MNRQNKFNRAEAGALSIALAVAGTLALINQLLPLWGSALSWMAVLHASPYLLVAVALSLVVAEDQAEIVVSSNRLVRRKEGKYVR